MISAKLMKECIIQKSQEENDSWLFMNSKKEQQLWPNYWIAADGKTFIMEYRIIMMLEPFDPGILYNYWREK